MSGISPLDVDDGSERESVAVAVAVAERLEAPRARPARWRAALLVTQRAATGFAVACASALLLLAAVPQSAWQSMHLPGDGPIPHAAIPLEAALFYGIPALVGALCRRWQVALILATLPAWIDLGVFVVAAAGQLGPFYLTLNHPDGAVGTLELYAALGGFGWLARTAALLVWRDHAGRWRGGR